MASQITVPFKPHPYQDIIIKSLRRFSVLVCHRRFGKSTLMINLLLRWALMAKRKAWRGAYIAPFRSQAKRIAWDYLKFYSDPVPGKKVNESELKVDFPNGSRIELLGADYPDSLRGPYWDCAIFDEYAQIRPNCFSEIIRPALVDRNGWAIFIGTPKGHNHFYDLWADYLKKVDDTEHLALMYKASQTNILDPEELEKVRAEQSPEEYEQEFECSFEAALIGAYYGSLMQDALVNGRITNVPYDPILPVHTAWDLGVDDANVIWFFQVHPSGEIRLIDYDERNNLGLIDYVKIVKEKPYVYGQHLAPHDIASRQYIDGRSRLESAQSLGIPFTVVPRGDVADGIQSARSIFPRCWFDQTKCDGGIQALKAYRKEYSEKLSTFRATPLHDWASHGADAFRCLATGLNLINPSIPILKIKMPTIRVSPQSGWML